MRSRVKVPYYAYRYADSRAGFGEFLRMELVSRDIKGSQACIQFPLNSVVT